ncbi:polysaccharide deacetylase family protein [Bacteroidota bacterium]
MLFVKTPVLIMRLFPELIWHLSSKEESQDNHVYLTFDDGPTPEVTPWVLDCLKQYKAKGTFFCLGRNVEKYPEIYDQILEQGHAVGNHTYSHLKGWKTPNSEYFDDVQLAGHAIESGLFRPPYGRFRKTQIRELRKDYKIVMWDVLSQDYDNSISPQKCLANVEANLRPGSIIVFHDSVKAKKNLYYSLPQILEKYSGKYDFLPIVKTPESSQQRIAV